MPNLLTGQRLGPLIVFRDEDGMRHAVRQASIMAVSESDGGGCTVIQLAGNRSVTVDRTFDEVLAWF